jgi:hypothetical protein
MRWAEHIARMGEKEREKNACRNLVKKPERKRPL